MKNPPSFTLILASLCLFPALSFGDPSELKQTQTQLKQLESKISQLENKLNKAQNKRETLTQELKKTEIEIGNAVQQITKLQNDTHDNQQQITALHQQNDAISQQLLSQQTLLASHLRALYKMGANQPLKWLLNQKNPQAINRLLTLYHYLLEARQKAIIKVQQTKHALMKTEHTLQEKMALQLQFQKQLHTRTYTLHQEKNYQSTLVQSIERSIQSKQTQLNEYQQNKANLTRLLKKLVKKDQSVHEYPFIKMKGKLPLPLKVQPSNIQPVNQGVELLTYEGNPVQAVSSGKVIFSDWLKGYGLLLIISHGNGYMTLYGHNQALFKKTGDTVSSGEQIAAVGHSGGVKENSLYFEIRHSGKALPPLNWLHT